MSSPVTSKTTLKRWSSHGYTEDAAYGRAVALMGDPEETGRALRAQYGGWWLVIVQRVARILTALLCVLIAGLIVKSSGLYGAIRDRYEVQKPGEGWERWNTETPGTRIPIGDDIVRIDAVSCSTQRAEVQLDGLRPYSRRRGLCAAAAYAAAGKRAR